MFIRLQVIKTQNFPYFSAAIPFSGIPQASILILLNQLAIEIK